MNLLGQRGQLKYLPVPFDWGQLARDLGETKKSTDFSKKSSHYSIPASYIEEMQAQYG